MADVFLSYASGDRASASRVAQALDQAGVSVWWDRHIKGGAEFSRDIEEQLDAAGKVLVLWSKESVNSRWVRDEASVAADSGRLIAATIDGTPAPLGFRQFQTLDLKGFARKGGPLPGELADALQFKTEPRTPSPSSPANRRMIAIAAAALVIALIGALWIIRPGPVDRWLSGGERSHSVALAILPFATSGDGDIAYLGSGLPGSITAALSNYSGLALTASTSAQAVAKQGLTATEIGKRLGVSHIVEGEVRKQGDRLAIDIRLVDAGNSKQLWSRNYDGSVAELQKIQGRIGADLAAALQARLDIGQGNFAENVNVDPRAYEAYLRGIEQLSLRVNVDSRVEALKQFRLAASIAPDFADAHAGVAYILALSVPSQVNMSWDEIKLEQKRAADRALQLDPNNLFAQTAQATAFHNFDGEIDRPFAMSSDILRRSPDFGPALYLHAFSLAYAGKYREALPFYDRAIERDPVSRNLRSARAGAMMGLRDYDGIKREARACTTDCDWLFNSWYTAMLAFATPEQYQVDNPELERIDVNLPPGIRLLARQAADAIILGKPFSGKLPEQPDVFLALMHAKLGSSDKAFELLNASMKEQQPDTVTQILNPGRMQFSEAQRADPRYHQFFNHPQFAKMIAHRRNNGVLDGLPVFPVRPLPEPN